MVQKIARPEDDKPRPKGDTHTSPPLLRTPRGWNQAFSYDRDCLGRSNAWFRSRFSEKSPFGGAKRSGNICDSSGHSVMSHRKGTAFDESAPSPRMISLKGVGASFYTRGPPPRLLGLGRLVRTLSERHLIQVGRIARYAGRLLSDAGRGRGETNLNSPQSAPFLQFGKINESKLSSHPYLAATLTVPPHYPSFSSIPTTTRPACPVEAVVVEPTLFGREQ
ncbi:hypothetical protein F4810DRAFT_714853 [Camillea tinctor]|nr:hypothetical protein F4810DRAFT_714853 [Camillea tinctor]